MSDGHIFISYRNLYEEPQFALKLAADLKNRGLRAWIDRMDIQPGDDWQDALERGINTCGAMIAVMSPDYVKSTYCKDELKRARRLERPIFPVLLRDVPPTDWPMQAEAIQYIDFREWASNEAAYQQAVNRLITTLQTKLADPIGDIPNAEAQYLTRLIAELEGRKGVLEYVDLAGQMDEPVRPKPRLADEWGLEGSFALLEQSSLSHHEDNSKQERIPVNDIREAVQKHKRFVLIGDPGAGKTTTLRRLALDAARERQTNPNAPLPVLLYLPSWGDEPTPADFLQARLAGEGMKPPSTTNLVLYLDGLNEMGAAGAEKAGKLRDWLAGKDMPEQVIVTCRAGDYAGDLDLKLPTVLAGVMDEARVRLFAANYLGDDAEKFLGQVIPTERGRKPDERSLFRLATNPYLLTALMVVYKSSPQSELPRNNGALFRRLAMALWERERIRGTVGWIPFEQMEAKYGQLAYWMIENELPTEVPLKYALKHIGEEALLRTGDSANLIAINEQHVRFYHQLMQEYFASVSLANMDLGEILIRPQFSYQGRYSTKWDEVIKAKVGISVQPEEILYRLISIDPWLASDCLSVTPYISDAMQKKLINQLSIFLLKRSIAIKITTIKAIGKIKNDTTLTILVKLLKDKNSDVRRSVAKALGQTKSIEAVAYLLNALNDKEPEVREEVARSLGYLGDSSATTDLSQRLLHERDHFVRIAVADALGKIGDKSAVENLITALYDKEAEVREAAAEALGEIGDTVAIPHLQRALYMEDWDINFAAAKALVELKSDAAVKVLIQALNHPDRYTRFLVLTLIAEYVRSPLIIPRVIELLEDTDPAVRLYAIIGLSEIGDPNTVDLLIGKLKDVSRPTGMLNRICDAVAIGLERIGTPEALEAVRKWREEQDKDKSSL